MNQLIHKLPRWLLYTLGGLGFFSFSGGMYLEWFQTQWLSVHPITVNLLSSLIAFSVASLVIGVGVNRITSRRDSRNHDRARNKDLYHLIVSVTQLARCVIEVSSIDPRQELEKHGDLFSLIKHLMGNLKSVPLNTPSDINRLVDDADHLLQNDIKPYAEKYLFPDRLFDRRVVHLMESCIREADLFRLSKFADSSENAKHNVALFGEQLIFLLETLDSLGHNTELIAGLKRTDHSPSTTPDAASHARPVAANAPPEG